MSTNIKQVEVAGVVHNIEDTIAREKIDAIKSTEVTTTAPTSENSQVWINPDSEESFSVPEIKDNTINSTDTWSSTKINSELESLKNTIDDNTEYVQKNMISVDENLTDSGKAADAKITGDEISSLKEDLDAYTLISNTETLKYGDYTLATGRVKSDGSIQTLSGQLYVTIDVSGIKSITIKIDASGSSGFGYCFYNADGSLNFFKSTNYTKMDTIDVPLGAVLFKYGKSAIKWEEENNITITKNIDKTYDNLNTRVTAAESTFAEIINATFYDGSKIGELDNLFQGKWNETGIVVGREQNIYVNDSGEKCGLKIGENAYYTSANDIHVVPSTVLLKIKKSSNPSRQIVFTNPSGSKNYITDDTPIGNFNTIAGVSVQGRVVKQDDEYITVFLVLHPSIRGTYTMISYSDSSRNVMEKLEFDEDRCLITLGEYAFSELSLNKKYYSIPEKIHSNLIGKTAILFSDSQVAFARYLCKLWGINLIVVSGGGCRMGNESGSGAGGETDDLWLCSDDRIQEFNSSYSGYDNVDFIINATGFNGVMDTAGNAETLAFVLNNKRWYFDDSLTNPYDSLSEEERLKFTSPYCYIAAFYSLTLKWNRAIPVVCDLYHTSVGTAGFSDGQWTDKTAFANAVYAVGTTSRSKILKEISEKLGAVFVQISNVGVSTTNIPYYAKDGVHANIIASCHVAYMIGNAINFPRHESEWLTEETVS